ncbi:MAG: hypothetical protein AAFV53_38150 [Myxococcota bacterium]
MRAATEPAAEKRAVPGAPALIRHLRDRDDARLFILSGSPTQMREVLEEKLRLDGVRYDGLILKDNLSNLRRGRFRAIRGQFGYKLPQLLISRRGMGRAVRETLFGDDAEVDALIYSVYADVLAGRLRSAQISRIMESAGAYPDRIDSALESIAALPTGEVVERIFIHLERGTPPGKFSVLGHRVVPVFSWWQAALVLFGEHRLSHDGLMEVLQEVISAEGLTDWSVAGLAQDMVLRGHLSAAILDRLPGALGKRCQQAIGRITPPPPRSMTPRTVDYLALLKGWEDGGR